MEKMAGAIRAALKLPRIVIAGLALIAATRALAHDPGISTAQGELRSDGLLLTTGFAPADAEQFLPLSARTGDRWTAVEFEAARDQLLAIAPQLWDIRAGETPI